MTSISQQLAMMQLSDSFFPTGSFTLSHGLETLVQTGQVQSAADLQTFMQILLRNKVGVTDVVALLHGHRGITQNNLDLVRQADQELFVQTAIAKNRVTQRQSGRALLMVASQTWQDKRLTQLQKEAAQGTFNCLHPVIFGAIAAIAELSEKDSALAFIHGFVTGVLSAAIRLSVVGHIQTQQILHNLTSDIEVIWLKAQAIKLEHMWSCNPAITIAQMQHSKLNQRLFAN